MLGSASTTIGYDRHFINNSDAYTVHRPLDLSRVDVGFFGEGDFSFTESWVGNYRDQGEDKVGHRVIASDILPYDTILQSPEARDRIDRLNDYGVQTIFCLDVTRAGEILGGHVFRRMQMNCPNDRSNYYDIPPSMPPIVSGFFQSSSSLLAPEGTSHLTIFQPPGQEARYQWFFRVVEGAEDAGLVFVDTIPVDDTRYPIYGHQLTPANGKWSTRKLRNAAHSQELVFVNPSDPRATTLDSRISEIALEVLGGPNKGDTVTTRYYNYKTGRKTSYSALPPMSDGKRERDDSGIADAKHLKVIPDAEYSGGEELDDDEFFSEGLLDYILPSSRHHKYGSTPSVVYLPTFGRSLLPEDDAEIEDVLEVEDEC